MTVKFNNTNPTEGSLLWYLQEYCKDHPATANNVKSAWIREYGKGLEGTKTNQKRLNNKTIARLENKLDKVLVNENFDFLEAEKSFIKGSLLVTGKVNKKRESYFKKLITYIKSKLKQEQDKPTKKVEPYSIRKPILDKKYIVDQNNKLKSKHNKSKKQVISITSLNLISRLQEKYPNQNQEELNELMSQELERLEEERTEIVKYLKRERRDVTIKNLLDNYYRLLGWKYKQESNLTIENIHFDLLIPVIDTKIRNYQSIEDKYIKEGLKRQEAEDKTDQVIKWLETFFEDYGVTTYCNAQNYINSMIGFAKFYYRSITDKRRAENFEDIDLIKALRVFKNECKKNLEQQAPTQIRINFEEAREVATSLKTDFDYDCYEYKNISQNGQEYLIQKKKTKKQRAKTLQKFLMVMLLVIYPPERQRTLRELTYGKTLKFGTVDNLGYFKELDPQDYQKNEGFYFIDLSPEDHKNGNEHYLDALFNYNLKNGTCVYDYLNLWLFEYRNVLANSDTTTFFVRPLKGDAHTPDSICNIFTSTFKRKTGVPVNPHHLRHVFATYINECEEAGENVKASAAYRMRHSQHMFNTVYNQQSQASKSKTINNFLLSIFDL